MTGGSKADGPLLEPECDCGSPDCPECVAWRLAEDRQLAFDRAEAQDQAELKALRGDDR